MVFFLSPLDSKSVAVACPPVDTPASYKLIDQLDGLTTLPFDLVLQDILFEKNRSRRSSELGKLKHLWLDYQPNSLVWPIFSERLKNLLDNQIISEKPFDWLSVTIRQNSKVSRQYYLLRFIKQQDVLNMEQSVFAGRNADFLVKPVFDVKKIENLTIFGARKDFWQITSGIYVSQKVKDAAKAQGLVGLNFESVGTV
ncbi:imm11 family protein [Hymenobacter baengnokdamensis]|uniref:imm11 family protein n=1 Tax=Hymenobacter baengnokdamensis TaxID=2615203 RepID=UPI001244D6A1|nr:DUF1629 domain-containing protein [Hymenobacter baengnokdamensis]